MKRSYLTATKSTCPDCRILIDAKILLEGNRVWIEKHCPQHGVAKVLLNPDVESYTSYFRYHHKGLKPLSLGTTVTKGCPDDCGLCPEHEQHVCTAIIEIADHCNLKCPICLVENPGTYYLTLAELNKILDRLIAAEGQIDILNLSGGEPTLHPEFEALVDACVARSEIVRVSVSTNGLRLAGDRGLAKFLAERNVVVSLQYDGNSDDMYRTLRGRTLKAIKESVLEQGFDLDAPMSLTMTLVRSVNESQMGHVLDLFFSHDHLLSLMIQPAAYVGSGRSFRIGTTGGITIPEVIGLISETSPSHLGIRASDFSPLPCSHPACFSLAFFLKTGERDYASVKRFVDVDEYLDVVRNRALFGLDESGFERVKNAIYNLWSGPAGHLPDSQRAMKAIRTILLEIDSSWGGFDGRHVMRAAERSLKSIFIHHFMDPDTFDLSRVRKCCTVYPQVDGRLIPVCAYNVLPSGRKRGAFSAQGEETT